MSTSPRTLLSPWWRWCTWAVTGLALIALYGIGYRAVRTRHRTTDGSTVISTGSRIADRVFAPAISTEQLFDQKPLNAEQLIQVALADAAASDRKVILAIGTRSCLPCRQLERFLEEQQAILSKYFLIVKIEVEGSMLQGDAVQQRYRATEGSLGRVWYFPWLAVLDGNGKLLVTSDSGPAGAIALPQGGPRERAWFLKLLQTANPRITDDELTSLDAAALAFHKSIWHDAENQEVQPQMTSAPR